MRRLWWSSVIPLAATLCLTFATPQVASAQQSSGARIYGTGPEGPIEYNPRSTKRQPGFIDPLCGTVGGPAPGSPQCNSQAGREWEGAASTDYFTYEPSVFFPPNPDIAVGPDDILTVVNRVISRYPNPNAPRFDNNGGTAPVTYSAANTSILLPTSRQFLDVWLGEAALANLCPTQPRSAASCVIDNASVRYDQMQGRYVVLFTVVDTGLVNCSGCQGTPNPQGRKASWVLIVSRWAVGCSNTVTASGATNLGSCSPDPLPNSTPFIPGNTAFFTTPSPPGTGQGTPNSGGVNTNWWAYYGTGDGTCTGNGCSNGNINSISDLANETGSGAVTAPGARTIDCGITAIGDTARVCYFPTSARLGLDNDNIVINSSVYDDNIMLANRGLLADARTPAFEGTRTRALKKTAIYSGRSSVDNDSTLVPGAAQRATPGQGDFYDLWGNSYQPIGEAAPLQSGYTHDRLVARQTVAGGFEDRLGCHFEPDHVRGRSLASYNGNGNRLGQFSTIWCTIDEDAGSTAPQSRLYHREIVYTATNPGPLATNVGGAPPTVALPLLLGGIPTLGPLRSHIVPGFSNPQTVTQKAKLAQPTPNNLLPTPYLYVGDDRPHRVISREGHRYIARVGFQADLYRFGAPGSTMGSTVIYDIVQKLAQGTAATATNYTANGPSTEVYNTNWGNGYFYAPMHDTPANVVQYGSVSPINTLPFLEKLFVGTTYPALSPSDPRSFQYGNFISATALQACKALDPGVGSGTNSLAYPGLFDIRCGEDAYDTSQAYRHPVTGSFLPGDFRVQQQPAAIPATEDTPAIPGFPNQIVPFGIRGGAATDPNNMGLWLYGAYSKGRLASIPGFGQWGTYVAHYPLSFPVRDPYNNLALSYTDVPPGHPFYVYVQIAKQTEIAPGSRTASGAFGVNDFVQRQLMAQWVVRAQMDEEAITDYLATTGGTFSSFADVATTDANWKYIETMYRRGYTKGCQATNDAIRLFCPTRLLSRGEMAVFIIRAKMNSVFPTVTSGSSPCQAGSTLPADQFGDLYGLFVGCSPYFSDVPATHPFFPFIQKLRELRITNGTALSTPTSLGTYDPDIIDLANAADARGKLTKGQIITFLVRAFFP